MRIQQLQRLSVKSQLLVFLLAFSSWISLREKTVIYLGAVILCGFVSAALETIIIFLRKKRFQVTESSVITGLIIGFVLSSSGSIWTFLCASFFSIVSKYVIRWRQKHIFNPAAFGVFLTNLFLQGYTQWKGAYDWFVIIPFGLYFVYRFRRLMVSGVYLAAFFCFYGVRSLLQGQGVIDSLLYANYFFILIMLIEPKTSPVKPAHQRIFSLAVCFFAVVLYLLQIPYDAELPALLGGNLIYFLLMQKRKGEIQK